METWMCSLWMIDMRSAAKRAESTRLAHGRERPRGLSRRRVAASVLSSVLLPESTPEKETASKVYGSFSSQWLWSGQKSRSCPFFS